MSAEILHIGAMDLTPYVGDVRLPDKKDRLCYHVFLCGLSSELIEGLITLHHFTEQLHPFIYCSAMPLRGGSGVYFHHPHYSFFKLEDGRSRLTFCFGGMSTFLKLYWNTPLLS